MPVIRTLTVHELTALAALAAATHPASHEPAWWHTAGELADQGVIARDAVGETDHHLTMLEPFELVMASTAPGVPTKWQITSAGRLSLARSSGHERVHLAWETTREMHLTTLITEVAGFGQADALRLTGEAARHGVTTFTAVLILTDRPGICGHITWRVVFDGENYHLYLLGRVE